MKLKKAIKIIKDIDVLDDYELEEAYETVFKELEHLLKENEELKKDARNRFVGCRDLVKKCKECTLNECISCEYSMSDIEITLKNFVSKNKIKDIIEDLKDNNEQNTKSVKLYEKMRRNTQDAFYKKSYQRSIHELNTKRELRKIFINILQDLLKEE